MTLPGISGDLETYRCYHCGLWHLGRRPKGWAQYRARMDTPHAGE